MEGDRKVIRLPDLSDEMTKRAMVDNPLVEIKQEEEMTPEEKQRRQTQLHNLKHYRPDLTDELILTKAGEVGARIYASIDTMLRVCIDRAMCNLPMPWETESAESKQNK